MDLSSRDDVPSLLTGSQYREGALRLYGALVDGPFRL